MGEPDHFGYQFAGETEAHSCNLSCHRLFIHGIAVPKSLYFTISRLVLYLLGHNISTGLSTLLLRILYQEEPVSDQNFRNFPSSQNKCVFWVFCFFLAVCDF